MMGGDIKVESELGRGSTFTLRLPVRVKTENEAAELGLLEPSQAAVPPPSAPSPPACLLPPRSTVLVIDDDRVSRELIVRCLSKKGSRVKASVSNEAGLKLAKELAPDPMTRDVMMPTMDSWGVLSALKTDPELTDIPVVMMTFVDDQSNQDGELGAAESLNQLCELPVSAI